jgi:hypothetical protein
MSELFCQIDRFALSESRPFRFCNGSAGLKGLATKPLPK